MVFLLNECKTIGREYSIIINRFEKKIKKDRRYFTYRNVSEDELIQIINQRGLDLLENALDELNSQITINHNVNFDDRDDDLEVFNFDLYRSDADLISDAMIVKYMEEEEVKLNKMETYLGNDIKTYCPADERNSFLNMEKIKKSELMNKLDNYNTRDRRSNQPLLVY